MLRKAPAITQAAMVFQCRARAIRKGISGTGIPYTISVACLKRPRRRADDNECSRSWGRQLLSRTQRANLLTVRVNASRVDGGDRRSSSGSGSPSPLRSRVACANPRPADHRRQAHGTLRTLLLAASTVGENDTSGSRIDYWMSVQDGGRGRDGLASTTTFPARLPSSSGSIVTSIILKASP